MGKNTKLLRYLSTCSGHELRRFRVFLSSPYFNSREELLRAWDLLRASLPARVELPPPAELHAAAYPGLAFDAARHRHLLSDLCGLLEEFWQLQQFERVAPQRTVNLLQVLAQRGLAQDFESEMALAQAGLAASPLHDRAYLRAQYDLALLHHDFRASRQNRGTSTGLEAAMAALDAEYFAHKLRLSAAALTRAHVLGEEMALPLLPEVIAASMEADDDLAGCYRLAIATLQGPDAEAALEALMQRMAGLQGRLHPETIAELHTFALNFCVRMVNLARPGYDAQLLELYALLLAQGHLREDGYLPVPHFKNYVTLSLRLGRGVELGRQLEQLARDLPPDIGPHALLFSRAAIAHHDGDHGRALRLLQQVEFHDVYYHLDAKSLLLKAWYAQGEVEPLLSLIEGFKTYLRRSRKISDYQRSTYRNLIKAVELLVRHRLGGRRSLASIRETLASLRPIADLPWVERQLDELA